jgi:hypothetical protein
MTISSIGSTQLRPLSEPTPPRHAFHKKGANESATSHATAADSPNPNTDTFASAMAGAMTQLALLPAPGNVQGNNGTTRNVPVAPQQSSPKASQQAQQYKDVASTFSDLTQSLDAYAAGTSPASSAMSTVFENLRGSLSAASTPSMTSSEEDALPNLPSFLQAMAQNLSESGISGLRGMFVDTIA